MESDLSSTVRNAVLSHACSPVNYTLVSPLYSGQLLNMYFSTFTDIWEELRCQRASQGAPHSTGGLPASSESIPNLVKLRTLLIVNTYQAFSMYQTVPSGLCMWIYSCVTATLRSSCANLRMRKLTLERLSGPRPLGMPECEWQLPTVIPSVFSLFF